MGIIELAQSAAAKAGDGEKQTNKKKKSNNTWAPTPVAPHSKHCLGNAAVLTPSQKQQKLGLPAGGFPERLKLRRQLTCENAEPRGGARLHVACAVKISVR